MKKEVIAVGQCYGYAVKQALENHGSLDVIIVHGTVHDAWDKHPYVHAWVEKDGKVYDWQTMEAGSSKYAGKGWPLDVFYDIFNPVNITKYTCNEAVTNAFKKYKHKGPWEREEVK